MKMIFCNNSESYLVTPLSDIGRYYDEWGNPPVQPPSWDDAVDGLPWTLEVRAADGRELNLPWLSKPNEVFPVTLTHESVPGVFEIVYVKAIEGNVLHVHERGAEGTGGQFWPVGTKVSANVTEGMLQNFAQKDGSTATLKPETRSIFISSDFLDQDVREYDLTGDGSFLFMARSPLRGLVQFGAYPVLHPVPSITPNNRYEYRDYRNHGAGLSHEASGNSYPVDIGEPPTWEAGRLRHGAVCLPVTPNGYQYWFDKLIETGSAWNFSAETEPDFYTDPSALIEMRRNIDGDEFMGNFVPTPMPVVQTLSFYHSMIPTEVGFFGVVDQGVTQMPVISVGTPDEPTKYVNAVTLSSLVYHEVDSDQTSVHRIPLSVNGPLTSALEFTVNQAAVGGSVRGFFYWRGLFFSMDSEV